MQTVGSWAMHLTKRYIDAARYEGDGASRDVRWDDDPRGLGARVYPSGRKAFVLSYRANGRKRLLTLGAYGPLTLDMARDIARRRLAEVIEGTDPVYERRKEGRIETFGDLTRLYLDRHAQPNKKPRSAAEDRRVIKRELLPKWASRRVTDIRRRDVIELLDAIADRPAPIMANRTLALVRKIFNFGIGRDIVEANPCVQVKPPGKERARQRVLEDHELRALWTAFEGLSPIMAAMFNLRLLTLQRGGEIATMRWDDVDTGWWTIPPERSKNQLAHRVPLSPQAMVIVKELEQVKHASGWVFPSPTRPGQHIANIGKAARRAQKIANVKDFRPHDLRRTGASRLTGLGVSRLVVSKILNHVESGITAVYDRHSYDAEKRHALDLWSRYVERIVAGQPAPSNVVELARAAQ